MKIFVPNSPDYILFPREKGASNFSIANVDILLFPKMLIILAGSGG